MKASQAHDRFRHWFVRQRTAFQYGGGWISNLSLTFLVVHALRDFAIFAWIPEPVLFTVGVAGVWIFGYLMIRGGWLADEQDWKIRLNPLLYNGLYRKKRKKKVER